MPNARQRRDAERRRLQRQLARRQQRAAARHRQTLILSIVGTVLVVAVIVFVIVQTNNDDKKPSATKHTSTHSTSAPRTSASPSPTPSTKPFVAKQTSGPCHYQTADTTADPALQNVGYPPDPARTPKQTLTVRFTTNRGIVEASLDGANAPCNVQAVAYLIHKKFYDKTVCPRVVDAAISIVQCGAGSGSGTDGGPTFTSPDENLATADYKTGAIAMANTGKPHTASSQFFFITKDSNSGLGKQYTVIGHVTKGLSILQQVVAAGDDGSSEAGGGVPRLPIAFTSVTIVGAGKSTPGIGPSPTLEPTNATSAPSAKSSAKKK